MQKYNYQCHNEQSAFVRPIVGAFLRPFRSRWNPIAPSKVKENPTTIDRPVFNISLVIVYFQRAKATSSMNCRTGS